MGTLGHNVFEPMTDRYKPDATTSDDAKDGLILFMRRKSRKNGNIIEATGKQTIEGFVVFSGSHIETNDLDSISPRIKGRRQKSEIDAEGILLEDMLFTSPSYAAASIIGWHVNGLRAWKTGSGITLKTFDAEE